MSKYGLARLTSDPREDGSFGQAKSLARQRAEGKPVPVGKPEPKVTTTKSSKAKD